MLIGALKAFSVGIALSLKPRKDRGGGILLPVFERFLPWPTPAFAKARSVKRGTTGGEAASSIAESILVWNDATSRADWSFVARELAAVRILNSASTWILLCAVLGPDLVETGPRPLATRIESLSGLFWRRAPFGGRVVRNSCGIGCGAMTSGTACEEWARKESAVSQM